jgi:hypothetical protein
MRSSSNECYELAELCQVKTSVEISGVPDKV